MSYDKHIALADELALSGIYESSRSIYDMVLFHEPTNSSAQRGLARLHLTSGKIEEALAALQNLHDGSPNIQDLGVLEDIAFIYHNNGRSDQAALIWYNVGANHYNESRFDLAEEYMWKSFASHAGDEQTVNTIIFCLQNLSGMISDLVPEDPLINVTDLNTTYITNNGDSNWHKTAKVISYFEAYFSYLEQNIQDAIDKLSKIDGEIPNLYLLKIRRLQAECYRMVDNAPAASLCDQEVIELMIELGQISYAKKYASDYNIKIDWPKAIQLIKLQKYMTDWKLMAVEALFQKDSQKEIFSALWQNLNTEWTKRKAGSILSDLIYVLNFSRYYNPSLALYLFNLSDNWHPPQQEVFMLENAISGLLHGAIPDYQRAHQLVHRWWRDHWSQKVSNAPQRKWAERENDHLEIKVGILDLTGMSAHRNYFESIVHPTLNLISNGILSVVFYFNTIGELPNHLANRGFIVQQINCALPSATETVEGDDLDVLLLINGFVPGATVQFFAQRPARRLALWMHSYCGYGPSLFDAAIVDSVIHTPFHDTIMDEPLVLTRGCPVLFAPHPDAPPISVAPRLTRNHITFGVFNRPAKFTDDMVQIWATILERVPNARLAFASNYLEASNLQNSLISRMSAAGIDPDRVDLLPSPSEYLERLALHSHIDIALDTYPFNGGMTTLEALWQGIPIITRTDEAPLTRSGLSLLTHVGLADLAAYDDVAYVDLAVSLAQDGPRLDMLRTTLRERMRSSSLMDAEQYTADFESVMRKIMALPARGIRTSTNN